MKKILLLGAFLGLCSLNAQTVYSYGFDSAFPVDWTRTNQSTPATTVMWGQGSFTLPLDAAIFGSGNVNTLPVGQAGGANSFAIVNFNSTSGAGNISNWLITPVINVKDGDEVSFYSRKGTDGPQDYPDRLELRYSTAATTVVPSTGATDVGSFTNLGVSVNPNLVAGFVYPKTWTKYSFVISGVGTVPVPVKFGFRYFVTNGGPSGLNSDIIGLDTFLVNRVNLGTSETAVKKESISISPNPTSDYLSIKSGEKINKVEVFDMGGRKVDVNIVENKVDVRNLSAGSYIINIETKAGKTTEKFIKK
ncbi:choice-of-anchor J domain-containing protein [Chryseobacterium sp. M5A1_1a]